MTSYGDATAHTGTGKGAVFTVTLGASLYTVAVAEPGNDFVVGNTLTFPGTLFGGATPDNDLVVTVATIATLPTGKLIVEVVYREVLVS